MYMNLDIKNNKYLLSLVTSILGTLFMLLLNILHLKKKIKR